MAKEVLYPDGSVSSFYEGGGSVHDGAIAMERLRLITAKSAIQIYLKSGGRVELTHGGTNMAVKNVIEPLTGKTYKRSRKGKEEALQDCVDLLNEIERSVVVAEFDDEIS